MYGEFKRQAAGNNDSHYHYKHELSQYDIIVSNLLFRVMLEIENPELIKEFFMKAN